MRKRNNGKGNRGNGRRAKRTWACWKEAMAWGLAWGGGVGRGEDLSLVRVPMRAPMAAP